MIKTNIENNIIYTYKIKNDNNLFLTKSNNPEEYIISYSLKEAGENHLKFCKKQYKGE